MRQFFYAVAGGFFLWITAALIAYVAALRDWFPGESIIRSVVLGFTKLPAVILVAAGAALGLVAALALANNPSA